MIDCSVKLGENGRETPLTGICIVSIDKTKRSESTCACDVYVKAERKSKNQEERNPQNHSRTRLFSLDEAKQGGLVD